MNSVFIRLHKAENNAIILVDVNSIDMIDTEEYNGRSVSQIIHNHGDDLDYFLVNESPDKIYQKLPDAFKVADSGESK